MKKLRRRKIAKLYGFRYKTWNINNTIHWGIRLLSKNKSYGIYYHYPFTDEDFLRKLKRYDKMNKKRINNNK